MLIQILIFRECSCSLEERTKSQGPLLPRDCIGCTSYYGRSQWEAWQLYSRFPRDRADHGMWAAQSATHRGCTAYWHHCNYLQKIADELCWILAIMCCCRQIFVFFGASASRLQQPDFFLCSSIFTQFSFTGWYGWYSQHTLLEQLRKNAEIET